MDKKVFVDHSAKLKKSTAGFRIMEHGRNFETAMIQEYQNTARLYQEPIQQFFSITSGNP